MRLLMPAPFKCQKCGFKTKVKDQLAGKRIKCPKCQTVGQVAAPAPAPAEPEPATGDSQHDLLSVNLDSFEDVEVGEGEVLDESQRVKQPKTKKKKAGAGLDPQVKVAAIGFS